MKTTLLILTLAVSFTVFYSCKEDMPPVSTQGTALMDDQRYYPTVEAATWQYRNDTISTRNVVTRDVSRRICTIQGTKRIDTLDYVLQVNQTKDSTIRIDTLYVRKEDNGIRMSSGALQLFSLLPLPGLTFPKEFLAMPYPLVPLMNWDILNFEYSISFFTIHFTVTASFKGFETVQTDFNTFTDCAHIRVNLDALFPNPQDPTNILNPLVIKEYADFWFARPIGLVLGDGSETVFELMDGRFSLNIFLAKSRHLRREIMSYSIPQSLSGCQ